MRFKRWAIAIAMLLAASPVAAAKPWHEARTDHFRVYMRSDESGIRAFAGELERFDMALRKLHGLPAQLSDAANPLNVFVLDDVDDLQKICTGTNSTRGCRSIMGFYNGRVSGSVAFTPRYSGNGRYDLNAQTILFHEYAHHFMLANWSGAHPAWFVEGFAEFNATARFNERGKIDLGLAAKHRYPTLFLGMQLPIERVLTGTSAGLNAELADSFYAKGWLLTHLLAFEKSRSGQLDAYLAALNKGVPALDAAKQAFGDLAALDREMNQYVRRRQMTVAEMPIGQLPLDAVRIRELTAGEQALMQVRLRSERGVTEKTAPIVVADARKLAAPFADDPGAQLVLAEAEFDADQDDAADAAADRALAARANDIDALIFKGHVAMRRLTKAKSKDAAAWKAARQWFVRANRVQPNAAEPLSLFYVVMLEQGEKPTANAIAGLQRAFELVPQDEALRFLLARQYLMDGKLSEGRVLLEPLAYNPHAAPDNSAAKLIALIDKKDHAAIKDYLARKPDAAEKTEAEPD